MDILSYFLIIYAIWTCCFLVVESGAVFKLKFVRFVNEDGAGDNGNCCDGIGGICPSECDHVFEICIDDPNGADSRTTCKYSRIYIAEITDKNTIDFSNTPLGFHTNPLEYQIDHWLGGVFIKINIVDVDVGNDDEFIDYISHRYRKTRPGRRSEVSFETVAIRDRVVLDAELQVYCEDHYYDTGCDVLCKPQDNRDGHYTCDQQTGAKMCNAGWIGQTCNQQVDDCNPNPCQNGGDCRDLHQDVSCTCKAGFTGKLCGTNINDCAGVSCGDHGSCEDLVAAYGCDCERGWHGRHCEHNTNECINEICQNGGTCVDGIAIFTCHCTIGWEGVHCEENIDDCVNSTCRNGQCVDGLAEYTCLCSDGWTGDMCETNIDDCINETCSNHGDCIDEISKFTCECSPGWYGIKCETNIDYCANVTCDNGGTCISQIDGYTCSCAMGWSGIKCDIDIDHCVHALCLNGGYCLDGIDDYSCSCSPGYAGRHCEIDIDDCTDLLCKNGGICVDGINNFTCTCPGEWSGTKCESRLPTNLGFQSEEVDQEDIFSAGVIGGIVAGGVILLLIILLATLLLVRQRRKPDVHAIDGGYITPQSEVNHMHQLNRQNTYIDNDGNQHNRENPYIPGEYDGYLTPASSQNDRQNVQNLKKEEEGKDLWNIYEDIIYDSIDDAKWGNDNRPEHDYVSTQAIAEDPPPRYASAVYQTSDDEDEGQSVDELLDEIRDEEQCDEPPRHTDTAAHNPQYVGSYV